MRLYLFLFAAALAAPAQTLTHVETIDLLLVAHENAPCETLAPYRLCPFLNVRQIEVRFDVNGGCNIAEERVMSDGSIERWARDLPCRVSNYTARAYLRDNQSLPSKRMLTARKWAALKRNYWAGK